MDPNKGQNGEAGAKIEVSAEEWGKLQDQITNLNKGIASVRDENGVFKSQNAQLQRELEEFKSKIDFEAEEEENVQLNPDDQKKLEKWAADHGFVTKEEFNAEKLRIQQESLQSIEKSAVSEFLEKHKEYDKDEEWAKVQAEFQLYKTPTTLEGYKKLLNKIHSELTGGTSKAREDGKALARAELHAKGRLSLGGGSQGGSDKGPDIESLQKKYPNLSREQIEERLSDIGSLYPKK